MDDNTISLLSVAQVARRLNRSIEQIRRYLREGKLRGRRIGQQWFVDEKDLPPLQHTPSAPARGMLRETLVPEREMGTAVIDEARKGQVEIKQLIERINAHREATSIRLGRELSVSVVEILRADRDSH